MAIKNKLFDNNRSVTSKKCPLSGKYAPIIDYKNIDLLKRYTTENFARKTCFSKHGRFD